MAVTPRPGPNRVRNVFITGIVLGILAALIVGSLVGGSSASRDDFDRIDRRLAAIEQRLATPSPTPQPSGSPGSTATTTVTAINQNPDSFVDKVVDLTGKVSSPHQGVGFILVDTDGTFIWVHSKDKIPSGSVTVHGKVVKLTDQVNQWKTEPGWPENDATLIARLRDEKVFLETVGIQ